MDVSYKGVFVVDIWVCSWEIMESATSLMPTSTDTLTPEPADFIILNEFGQSTV